MKKLLFLTFVLLYSFSYSQDKQTKKWHSTIDAEIIVPNKLEYSYSYYSPTYDGFVGGTDEIKGYGISYGLLYSINYNVFKKLSLGLITGFQSHNSPDFDMLKLGGSAKYFFVDNNNVYTYINLANDFSLNKNQFKNGGNFRLGIGFPVMKRENFNLNVNVFWEQNFLRMEDAEPLFDNENPKTAIFKSYGVSLGVKF